MSEKDFAGIIAEYEKKFGTRPDWPANLIKKITEKDPPERLPKDIEDTVKRILESLPEREGQVLYLRYRFAVKLDRVAESYKVTRERIRQIVEKGAARIRHRSSAMALIETGFEGAARIECAKAETSAEYLKRKLELIRKISERDITDEALDEMLILADKIKADSDPTLEELADEIPVRAYTVLRRSGVTRLSQIAAMDYAQILSLRNMGRKTCEDIIKMLEKRGLKAARHDRPDDISL